MDVKAVSAPWKGQAQAAPVMVESGFKLCGFVLRGNWHLILLIFGGIGLDLLELFLLCFRRRLDLLC